MTPTIGSIVANKFQLVRELGRGSMGAVWLADHLTLQTRCAVKFMTGDASRDPNFRSRFEFEARAVAQLQSPHIVRVLDYAVDQDVPFIAMEYLQGEDLCVRLSRAGRLDAATTYRILSQAARGLAKAHLAGLVHRDIKPENIFLSQEDDEEVVKLLDFGVAKSTAFAVHSTATQAGSLLGTPAYMSPEQARGVREIDHRADLWSLAVIAFQCLTGKLPFDSTTLGELFALIMYEPIPVPTKIAPWLSPEFDAWWAKAAARSPEDRFASAREMADALGRALALPGVSTAIHGEQQETFRGGYVSGASPMPEEMASLAELPLDDVEELEEVEDVSVTSTQSAITRSLRGARQIIGSPRGRYAAAAVVSAALVGVFAVFGPSPRVGPVGHAAAVSPPPPAVAPSHAADSVAPPVTSPPTFHEPAIPELTVEALPSAAASGASSSGSGSQPAATSPSSANSTSESSPRASTSRARSSSSQRAASSKRASHAPKSQSDDVDFGI